MIPRCVVPNTPSKNCKKDLKTSRNRTERVKNIYILVWMLSWVKYVLKYFLILACIWCVEWPWTGTFLSQCFGTKSYTSSGYCVFRRNTNGTARRLSSRWWYMSCTETLWQEWPCSWPFTTSGVGNRKKKLQAHKNMYATWWLFILKTRLVFICLIVYYIFLKVFYL